ncbi:MAG: SMC-Scp complex subunit ScpB [Clostridiales bacterium]|nr:SMC-Scp complex subunit ScpB [Clostridiales bacterium]
MEELSKKPLSTAEIERIIEAALFAAGYPLTYEKLAELVDLPSEEIKQVVCEYAGYYNDESARRGVQLVLYENSCQLCTKEAYQSYVKAALGIKKGGSLSPSTLEVLSIVAYHQPVTKAYVEQIRGVDCSYAVSNLVDKQLIETKGRLDVPGKPYLYVTTDDFLRCFGLASLDDLPDLELFADSIKDESVEIKTGESS